MSGREAGVNNSRRGAGLAKGKAGDDAPFLLLPPARGRERKELAHTEAQGSQRVL